MKLSPDTKSTGIPRRFAAGLALAVVLLAGLLACAGKTKSARPGGPTSAEKRDQSFALPLRDQVRWSYAVEPTPPPTKKPAYLLKTIGFAKGSVTVDGEAAAVLRDLAGQMKERPKMRVLFLGLTDKGSENLNAEDLGMKRGRAAREFVIAQGIAKDRTELATLGSRAATGDPSDAVAQEKDRRAEAWLLEE